MAYDPGERALCELCGRKGALEAAERRALKGRSEALCSPNGLSQRRGTRCGSPTVRSCLGLHGVPRRGAPSQAREASRAVWSARGLGKSLPTPAGSSWQFWDSADCKWVRAPRGSSGLAGPSKSARPGKRDRKRWDAGSPPVRAIPGRGERLLSSWRPGLVAAPRALSTTTSQLKFLLPELGETEHFPEAEGMWPAHFPMEMQTS